jgi:hypothetical protein
MSTRPIVSEAALAVALLAAGTVMAQPACRVSASGPPPQVVELYTSEGCNSCPPEDRWLSGLKGQPGVLPLAFHVDYFDNLGWRDRFGDAAHSRRQKEQLRLNGAPAAYTPQVVVNGRDRRTAKVEAPVNAGVALTLQREGDRLVAQLSSQATAPITLAGFWAATENDLSSAVGAGENAGVTLHHDFVVRDYRKLKPLTLKPGDAMTLDYAGLGTDGRRAVALVLSDAASGRPVQALRWSPGC